MNPQQGAPFAPPAKITVGLSGGVDSAVAALLLKRQGYRVTALFMRNWDSEEGDPYCTVEQDLADATAVSQHLDIPLQTANFAESYRRRVFAHFLDEHRAGRTPNPDVLCNREIKFDMFLKLALQRIERPNKQPPQTQHEPISGRSLTTSIPASLRLGSRRLG